LKLGAFHFISSTILESISLIAPRSRSIPALYG
jgi:hypothetical protein